MYTTFGQTVCLQPNCLVKLKSQFDGLCGLRQIAVSWPIFLTIINTQLCYALVILIISLWSGITELKSIEHIHPHHPFDFFPCLDYGIIVTSPAVKITRYEQRKSEFVSTHVSPTSTRDPKSFSWK